jgi:hypothetical protein
MLFVACTKIDCMRQKYYKEHFYLRKYTFKVLILSNNVLIIFKTSYIT